MATPIDPKAFADMAIDENKPHPSRKVFHVAELFERVLLHVPIQDLILNVPLVCKHWKDTIATSPNRQQGLFLRPIAAPPASDDKLTIRVLHPMSRQIFSTKGFMAKGDTRTFSAFRNPNSWKRMLMFQPPLAEIDVYWYGSSYLGVQAGPMNERVSHYINQSGSKLGAYGARTQSGRFSTGYFLNKHCQKVLHVENEIWKTAKIQAEVFRLLGVEGEDRKDRQLLRLVSMRVDWNPTASHCC